MRVGRPRKVDDTVSTTADLGRSRPTGRMDADQSMSFAEKKFVDGKTDGDNGTNRSDRGNMYVFHQVARPTNRAAPAP